ncbi:MAG: hypothetical protein R3D44_17495 [Hyphomicrobiaceae bacterium]
MSLFGALSELVGGAALACAPACDLELPASAVEDQASFVAWLSERKELREIRPIVEDIGREIWVGAETRGLAQRDLDQHIRAAARLIIKFRPSAALMAEIAVAAQASKPAAPSGEPVAGRIASDIVARARTSGAFSGGLSAIAADIPLREEVILVLLDRTFSHLVGSDGRLTRLGPALRAFGEERSSPGEKLATVSGIAGLGISRDFVKLIEQAGGPAFLADLAERYSLSERCIRRLVALVDGQSSATEGRLQRLNKAAQWLADVRAQLMRPSNDDAEIRRLKTAAATTLADGDFEAAMDALRMVRRELREARRRTEERLQDEALALRTQMTEEGRATARLAELLVARGEHAQAAELFAEAAMALPRSDRETAWRFNLQRADALLQQARERGDNAALNEALAAYGSLVRQAAETTNTKALAEACLGHGEALFAAGERDSAGSRLNDAITIFQKAIQLLERERDHAGLMRARIALAKAMARQGERDGSVDTLKQAAQALRDALAAVSAEKFASDHIGIQLNLGGVLLAIEERGGAAELLGEAAEAYRAALALMDGEADSDQWGETQMNLGLALLGLGEQSGSVAQLEEAVQAFRESIEVTPRVRAPRRWALTQMNLGNALAALGDKDEKGTDRLHDAIAAYHLALEELLREAEPLKWAITQMNLGTALIRLGERVDRRRHWLAAAAALMPALEVFEQQGADDLAEMTRHNLKRFQESWDSLLMPQSPDAQAASTRDPHATAAQRPRLAQAG